MLPGGRRAVGVGSGIELSQLRPYEAGDDVRYLDPAASARTGNLHIRLHVPERAVTTWIVLDLSPSMAFGTAQRLKADVAEGVVLVFGRLGIRRAGSVGLVAFGAGHADGSRVLPPRGAKPAMIALRKLLAEGVAPDGRSRPGGARRRARPNAAARHPAGAGGRDLRLSRPAALGAPARGAASAPRDARDRDRGPTRGRAASGRASGARRPRDRASWSMSTARAGRYGSVSRRSSASAAKPWPRSCAGCAVDHVALATDQDWLAELGRRIR